MNMLTIDRAAEIVRTHPDQKARQDLFVLFESLFWEQPNRIMQQEFADMCVLQSTRSPQQPEEDHERWDGMS